MNFCKVVIKNRISTKEYRDAIQSVYAPNKGPITKEIVLPIGAVLTSANDFYKNNAEVLKKAALNLNPKKS